MFETRVCFVHFIAVICRNKSACQAGREVSISYEDKILINEETKKTYTEMHRIGDGVAYPTRDLDKKSGICVDAIIGGSVRVDECRCGYPFCCGDLARRFYRHQLRDEDYYLMLAESYRAMIMMSRLAKLNVNYLQAKTESDSPTDLSLSQVYRYELIHAQYGLIGSENTASRTTKIFLDGMHKVGNQAGSYQSGI